MLEQRKNQFPTLGANWFREGWVREWRLCYVDRDASGEIGVRSASRESPLAPLPQGEWQPIPDPEDDGERTSGPDERIAALEDRVAHLEGRSLGTLAREEGADLAELVYEAKKSAIGAVHKELLRRLSSVKAKSKPSNALEREYQKGTVQALEATLLFLGFPVDDKPSEEPQRRSFAAGLGVGGLSSWLRKDESGVISRARVADMLDDLSALDILMGLESEVGSEQILDLGAAEGWWS